MKIEYVRDHVTLRPKVAYTPECFEDCVQMLSSYTEAGVALEYIQAQRDDLVESIDKAHESGLWDKFREECGISDMFSTQAQKDEARS